MSLNDLLPLTLDKLTQYGVAGLNVLAREYPALLMECQALGALLPVIVHIPAVEKTANLIITRINTTLGYTEPATV